MMIPSSPLSHWRTAKLTTPEDERIVQHASLFQVLDQGRRCLVHVLRRGLHAIHDATMMIPGTMIELDHSHAALRHATG